MTTIVACVVGLLLILLGSKILRHLPEATRQMENAYDRENLIRTQRIQKLRKDHTWFPVIFLIPLYPRIHTFEFTRSVLLFVSLCLILLGSMIIVIPFIP